MDTYRGLFLSVQEQPNLAYAVVKLDFACMHLAGCVFTTISMASTIKLYGSVIRLVYSHGPQYEVKKIDLKQASFSQISNHF